MICFKLKYFAHSLSTIFDVSFNFCAFNLGDAPAPPAEPATVAGKSLTLAGPFVLSLYTNDNIP